jgi:drug/metabolite transporter (DMT)-like permease
MTIDAPPRSRVAALAPALFVLLWSTGFIVARFATRDAGPLTFLAVRMVIAAGMLALVAVGTRSPRPSAVQTRWLVVSGLGMHAIYLGGVFIAIDLGMPSGVGALIAGLHPVVTALAARRVLHEHLVRLQWIGVGLGFLGVVAVVVDRLLAHSTGLTGWALLGSGLSVLGMSGGTLVQRRYAAQAPLLWGTVVQYSASAVVLGIGAVVFERIDIRFTAQTWFALVWAVVVLSIAAVLIMLWLLQRQAAAKVSSLFFLTPALSALEGALLFGERLGPLAVVGLVVGLMGVALVTRPGPRSAR